MRALVLPGWGWKEYPVAAAALRALGAHAEVLGISRRRLPEFLEGYEGDVRRMRIFILWKFRVSHF